MAGDIIVIDDSRDASSETVIHENMTNNPDGSKTIRLQYPVKYKTKSGGPEQTLEELRLKRPNTGFLILMEKTYPTEMERLMAGIVHLSGIHSDVFKQIDIDDLMELKEVFLDFFSKHQPTGETS